MQAARSLASAPKPFTAARVAVPRIIRQPVVCPAAAVEAPVAKKLHPSPLNQAPPPVYAIVEVGGTQLFVEPGKWYTVNRLKADVGAKIKFGRVLALKKDGKLAVGMPYLETVNVEAEVLEELRAPKVLVYKMKPKKHYRCERDEQCLPNLVGQMA